LSSFLKENSLWKIETRNFAVRAFDNNNKEILYAISSKKNAELITKANSIDWLKSTLFQENTDDYRLSIAKRQIAEIENALRKVIVEIQFKKHGENWWEIVVGEKLNIAVKKVYSAQFGEDTAEGKVLIQFTYITQLKKIICANWTNFKHLFKSKIEFENSIDNLNVIRRKEAHNRLISEENLKELKKIYENLLIKITQSYTDIVPNYLIDNWKTEIKSIMLDIYQTLYKDDEIKNELNPQIKLIKSTAGLLNLINYIKTVEKKLNSIVVPIQKLELHNELVKTYVDYRKLNEKLMENAKNREFDKIKETLKEIENYKTKIDYISKMFLLSES